MVMPMLSSSSVATDMDLTYHFYYDGDRIIETRNGSDLVLKQQL